MTDLTPEAVKAALERATPGPWEAGRNSAFWEVSPEGERGDRPYTIADVCASEPGDPDGGLQEANANLIAMAPDLARDWLRLKEENAVLRTEKHADAEAIGHLKEVEKLGRRLVGYAEAVIEDGCPKCGGDCSSANPPVYFCPIREAKSDIAAFYAAVEGK